METPNVTVVQIKAAVLWLFSFLMLVGVNVGAGTQDSILLVIEGFMVTVLPTALVLADALIRRARANNVTAITQAKVTVSQIEQAPAPALIGDGE